MNKMSIYPKCERLKVPLFFASLFGIVPWQLMFQRHSVWQTIYSIYSRVILGHYMIFLACSYVKAVHIMTSTDLKLDELSPNLCVTLLHSVTVIRQLIIKLDPKFIEMVQYIINQGNLVKNRLGIEELEISRQIGKANLQKTLLYLMFITLLTFEYLVRPALLDPMPRQIGNYTQFVRALPMSIWVPFDEQEYYYIAYIWQCSHALVASSVTVYTDILILNLMMYPMEELVIMEYNLKNFNKYRQKLGLSTYATFINIIHRHRDVIEYVKVFNQALSLVMLVDFVQSSLHIATILTQILGNNVNLLTFLFVGTHLLSMLFRLFLYYYYANETLILSEHLAQAVWESDWYLMPLNVKCMVLVFIQRTQKPLKFLLGPFNVMSLQSLISLLRVAYSYTMLLYSVH